MAVIERRPSTREPSPQWGPPPESPRRRRFTRIALALVVLAVAIGGGLFLVNRPSHKAAPPAPAKTNTQTSTPSATAPIVSSPNPTTVQQSTNAAVLAGYRAEDSAFDAVIGHTPVDPTDPRLAATMTGGRLAAIRNSFTILRLQGRYGVGAGAELAPVITSVNGTTAIVSDCIFDHGRLVDRTGQTVSGPDTARSLKKVTLWLEGGAWKVAGYEQVGVGCVPGA